MYHLITWILNKCYRDTYNLLFLFRGAAKRRERERAAKQAREPTQVPAVQANLLAAACVPRLRLQGAPSQRCHAPLHLR